MIAKSILFFLISITIIYVYLGQKSQNELIIKLEKEIQDIKLSMDIKIKNLINQTINQDTIDNIKSQISKDVDNIIKKQFEINKAKFNQNQITPAQKEEIIKNTQKQIKTQIEVALNQFKTNEFYPIRDKVNTNLIKLQESNAKLSKLEQKLNKTIDQISVKINAEITNFKTTTLANLETKILDSIKLLKNMDSRITNNSNEIKNLHNMMENHFGVDASKFISFDVEEALSINVNGKQDNAGGPSYLIFDNQKMKNKDDIVTITAKYDINIYGIFIGRGSNGGRGYLLGRDHDYSLAHGGNGGSGNGGKRIEFSLKKGDQFNVQFDNLNGKSILKTPNDLIELGRGTQTGGKGGSGGGHNSYGGRGEDSKGPDVSDIIKTNKKKDGTIIFDVLPTKFGGGGSGGHGGWWAKDGYGKSGFFGKGGNIRGRNYSMTAQRFVRNYGAGGGGYSSRNGNPLPKQKIYTSHGGEGGLAGLIIVVEKQIEK